MSVYCRLCGKSSLDIRVYNSAADLVAIYPLRGVGGPNTFPVDVGRLSPGLYYYIVEARGLTGVRRSKPVKFAVVR
jgi:hypothetical protein